VLFPTIVSSVVPVTFKPASELGLTTLLVVAGDGLRSGEEEEAPFDPVLEKGRVLPLVLGELPADCRRSAHVRCFVGVVVVVDVGTDVEDVDLSLEPMLAIMVTEGGGDSRERRRGIDARTKVSKVETGKGVVVMGVRTV
jgi:hypothetical protein